MVRVGYEALHGHVRALYASPMALWRTGFYVLMGCSWVHLHHGPMVYWEEAFLYDHTEWFTSFTRATTESQAAVLRWGGCALAFLSVRSNWASVGFACMYVHYLMTAITNFVNHDYLFTLLSFLLAFHNNAPSATAKRLWVHAMRAQIVVVYAFASWWKLDPDWLDGTICSGIFLSFEEQGVARGVPWAAIHHAIPWVFRFVAVVGILLDTMLFFTLGFLPLGNKLQAASVVFHAFTGFTMSQRIGYAFPIAMILSGLLFQPTEHESSTQCHFEQVVGVLSASRTAKTTRVTRACVIAWIVWQWLMPLRMPLVSNSEFKYTQEAYRFSWTMMLHSKQSYHGMGMFFADLHPICGRQHFPNPMAARNPFANPTAFEYLPSIGPRGGAAAALYTRQLPRIAGKVHQLVTPMCGRPEDLRVTTTLFSAVNGGAFVRLGDPTVSISDTFFALQRRSMLGKWWGAFWDKVPEGHEFILRGAGTGGVRAAQHEPLPHLHPATAEGARDTKRLAKDGWATFVDRSPCMAVSPLRLFGVAVELEIVHLPEHHAVTVQFCKTLDPQQTCDVVTLYSDDGAISVPVSRVININIETTQERPPVDCAHAAEDVILRVRKRAHMTHARMV